MMPSSPEAAEALRIISLVQKDPTTAQPALLEYMRAVAAPHLALAERADILDETVAKLAQLVVQCIQSGALARPEFLPSFVQIIAWQEVKQAWPGEVRPGWQRSPIFGILVPGQVS